MKEIKALDRQLRRRAIGNLTLKELARRVRSEMQADAIPGRAAELAFYLTLAFFPLLMCIIVALSFVPGAEQILFGYLDTLLPKEVDAIVHNWLQEVLQRGGGSLLSVSLIFTLWSASNGVSALIEVFNTAYEVEEGRSFWKIRLVALALTLGLAMLVVGGALVFVFGSFVTDFFAKRSQLGPWMHFLVRAGNHLLGLGMLFCGISALHYFGPNVKQSWRFFSPGSVFSVVGILIVSYLISFYIHFIPALSAIYGSLGAIVVFMLWIYLVSIMLLVGAEVDDEIMKGIGDRPTERV